MLPFKAETIEEMRGRFAPVRATLFSIEAIESGKCERPGKLRDFIFDFEDGLRLIISREFTKEARHLHVSCSLFPDSTLVYVSTLALRDDILYRLKELCDLEYEVENMFITNPAGVIHLLLKDIC